MKAVKLVTTLVLLTFFSLPTMAQQNACAFDRGGPLSVNNELRNVKAAFYQNGSAVVQLQLLFARDGSYSGPVSGTWNRELEAAILCSLQSYIAIGGRGNDWGVNQPSDAIRFVGWVYEALVARETGGEYPD